MADIARIKKIVDPGKRAAAIGRVLNALPDVAAELRAMRQQAVLELRAQNLSYAEIGERLGLHRNRVQQIADGRPGGGRGAANLVALHEWWSSLDPSGQSALMDVGTKDALTPEEFDSIRAYLPEEVRNRGSSGWIGEPASERRYALPREYVAFIGDRVEQRATRRRLTGEE